MSQEHEQLSNENQPQRKEADPALIEELNPLQWSHWIIEGLEETLFSIDKTWRFTYLNHQAEKVWGRSRQNLLGKSMWEEFPTLKGTRFEEFYRQAMAGSKPQWMEEFSPTAEGWYEVRTYPIPQGLVVYFQDITERKQIEQKLIDSEYRFEFLSNATTEGVVVQQNGVIVEANRGAARLFGYNSPEEMIGQRREQHFSPETVAEIQSRLAQNPDAAATEITLIQKDGAPIEVEWHGHRTEYKGQSSGLAILRDITERKQQERLLRESEERFKFLSDATNEAVAVIRDGRTIIEANQSAAKIYGYDSPEELIGMASSRFVAPEYLDDVFKRVAENYDKTYETVAVKKDGTYFPVEAHSKTLEYRGQTVRVVTSRDISERKQQEQQLRESEERYRVLSEAAYEGLALHDGQQIVEVNQTFAEMYGYSREELIGKPVTLLTAPDSQMALKDRVANYREKVFEARALRKDGTHFFVESRSKPIEYQGRQLRLAAVRDVTELRLAQQQLEESEHRFRVLSEATLEGIVIHRQGIILEANESIAHMLGFNSSRELIGRFLFDLVVPEDRAAIQKQAAEGVEEVHELRSLKQGGSPFPMEVRGKNIEYQGQPARQVVLRDITERKLKEQALKESEERYKFLSEAAYEGLVLHSKGIIQEANQRGAKMFGYSREELIGMYLLDLAAPEERPALLQRLTTAYESAGSELIGLRKDGTRFFLETRGRVIDYQGQLMRLSAFRDVTDLNLAEEALRKTQAQLLQSQKMEGIGRLAGGIAHDFNNLLTAMIGYSEFALRGIKEEEPLYEYLSEIMKAGQRAADLTRQLLAFSRQQVLQPRIINLNKIVTDMDKLLHRLIGEDLELLTVPHPQLGDVLADPGQIEQVIVNLAVNARDAMPGGGKLTIETANVELDEQYQAAGHPQVKTGAYVMLAVSDTGTGMDQATQQKIFEPFFTTKETGKGTGLGLATVYGIVEQSGGYISVYSVVGIGTTFKIYLPRVKALPMLEPAAPTAGSAIGNRPGTGRVDEPPGANEAPPKTVRPRAKTGKGRTVLVVEDEDSVRDLISQVLHTEGYEVLLATNGTEALEIIKQPPAPIDLVLTDVVMPQMGGGELIRSLKETGTGLKVVCMSGYTDRAVVRHDILIQCNSFLQKPFTPSDLLERVEANLENPAQ